MFSKTRVALGMGLFSLMTVLPLSAQDIVTVALRSGARPAGELTDMNASGVVVRVAGEYQTYPLSDIKAIEFMVGAMAEAQAKIAAGQPFVILRTREIVDGKLIDISDRNPVRLTFQTPTGTRLLPYQEIAQVWVNPGDAPAAMSVAPAAPAPAGAIKVPANVAWTNTGIAVPRNMRLVFTATGDIMLGPGMSSGVGGSPAVTVPGAKYPLRTAGSYAGALIGRIGNNGTPFLVGGTTEPIPVTSTGLLYLGVNDDVLTDNSGEYTVTVSITGRR